MNRKTSYENRGFFQRTRQNIYPFFWFVAAADEDILQNCSVAEQDKQASIGIAIVCTSVAAMISCFYAVNSIFGSVAGALLIGLFWGLIIFNLDRFMVSSIHKQRQREWSKLLVVAVPRILLAIFIALLISKPLEIKIFQNQINEGKSNFTSSLQAGKYGFESSELSKDKGDLERAKEDLDRISQESKDLENDATYSNFKHIYQDCLNAQSNLEKRLDTRRALRQRALERMNPSAAASLANEINNLKRQIRLLGCGEAEKQMNDRGEAYLQEQRYRVDAARKRLDSLYAVVAAAAATLKAQRVDAGQKIEKASNDILGQLRILDTVKEKDPSIKYAGWLITTLFFLLEVAPLMVKLLSPRGKYDTLLAIIEKEAFDNEEATMEESKQKKLYRQKVAVRNANETEEIDEKRKQQIQEKILNAQADLAEKIIEAWKTQEEVDLHSNREEYLNAIITKS